MLLIDAWCNVSNLKGHIFVFVTLFWLCVFVFMYLSSLPVSLAILISQRSPSLSLAGNPGVGTSEALRLPGGEERCRHSRSPP